MIVLPAYAGMILRPDPLPLVRPRAPRVCGDDPADLNDADWVLECSPRMRG